MMMRNSPWFFKSSPLLRWGIPHDFPESSPAMDLKSPRGYSPFRFHSSPTLGARCWWLRVKWHRTYKTHERQTGHHSGQRNRTAQASLRFILYSFPGQNSRLYDEAFSVERVCMISYSKREWNCGLLQSLSRALSSSPSQEGNDKEESVPLFARDH